MHSIFGYTPNRVNYQQENNVVARKPGLSTRKPFAERKIDTNVEQASTVQTKATSSEITKPPSPHDEIFVDFCSYKDVPDNYADVMNPEEINNITSILFGNVPKTPPPKRGDIFEPNYIENNNYKVSNHMDYDTDIEIIASMNLCGLDMFNITEPPSPVFDFL